MRSKLSTTPPKRYGGSISVWQPHQYQKDSVRWLVARRAAALFQDPGLGKSSITLEAFRGLRLVHKKLKGLVIAPLRVCYAVWDSSNPDSEMQKWQQFSHLKSVVLHGSKKEQRLKEDADLYVINPEGLDWLMSRGGLHGLIDRGVKLLIIDELTKFKHTRTVRFKKLKRVLPLFDWRWGLTGSPAANGLMDLFGQAYVLDLGKAFGEYITKFRLSYFMQTGYGGYTWVPQKGAEDRIYKALAPLAMRTSAKDHLDLPPLVTKTTWLDLPDAARKIYDELEDELITTIDDGVIVAANAAVAMSKCRQVASGGLYQDTHDGKRKTIHLHDAKTDALEELVDELQGSPLLIGYEFQHDLERLQQRFKDLPYIGGGVSQKRTTELIQAWNNKELPLLAGHPAAMGHGLNLQQAGSHVAWYTLTWDYEQFDQFIRRVYRQGNESSRVIIHMFLMRKTVDEAVFRAINAKAKGQQQLFDALVQLAKERRGGVQDR